MRALKTPRRLRVDREPGDSVREALQNGGHDVDLVSVLLVARGAPADEVFGRATLDHRVLVTADPSYADVGRFEVTESSGLVLFCLETSTFCDALGSAYQVHKNALQNAQRAIAEAATSAKRLELSVGQLSDTSKRLYTRARQSIADGHREAARDLLATRAANYETVRLLTAQKQVLDESVQRAIPRVRNLQSAAKDFGREKEAMTAGGGAADPTSTSDATEADDLEAMTAKLVDALAKSSPERALWLVLPDADWEIPTPNKRGPVQTIRQPRRLDSSDEAFTT